MPDSGYIAFWWEIPGTSISIILCAPSSTLYVFENLTKAVHQSNLFLIIFLFVLKHNSIENFFYFKFFNFLNSCSYFVAIRVVFDFMAWFFWKLSFGLNQLLVLCCNWLVFTLPQFRTLKRKMYLQLADDGLWIYCEILGYVITALYNYH